MKKIILIITLINFSNLNAFEIIRDQVFEHYLKETLFKLTGEENIEFRLINDVKENAFVINNDYIFFTKGILKSINNENALISIMLHEYGHIKKNHIFQKKIKAEKLKEFSKYNNIFSLLVGLSLSNTEVMFGTSLTINEGLIQDYLKNSVVFENEADDLMIYYLNKNNLDKQPIYDFLDDLSMNNLNDSYRKTHPTINDRKKKVLAHITKGNKSIRDNKFTYLKAKYFMNSKNEKYNNFFRNIKNGKNVKIEDPEFKKIFEYELFKVGMSQESSIDIYNSVIKIFNNSYVKLEFLNHLIDNDYHDLLLKNINIYKNNKNIKNEFYYLYIMGKVYDYLNQKNESFFYFCNFYKKNNIIKLSNYYCNKYDRNKISIIDLVNEINVDINQ